MALATKTRQPTTTHHRKRVGSHHRKQTKHYGKTYWPYLPLLGIAGFGFMLNMLWWQPHGSVLAYATNTGIATLLQDTNAQRLTVGEKGLVTNAQLMSAAQAKADDMASRNYWAHVTPDGHQPWWFVTNAGYQYQSTGENLAYGFDNSQATITGWMNSPGHRANILNAEYQDVGFGIANAADYQGSGPQTIVVALYGSPLASVAAAVPTTAKALPKAAPASVSASKSASPPVVAVTTNPASNPTTSREQTAVLGEEQAAKQPTTAALAAQPVSRLAAIRPISPAVLLTLLGIAAFGAALFIARHTYYIHRAIIKGEGFMLRFWKLDVAIVAIVVVIVLLTRTAGFIQ